jgi:hypothetical protein
MKKRGAPTRNPKPQLNAVWQALDDAAFGAERTLNLREMLPSAAEARARTDVWLRARQVTRTEEVLIITGRGNQSPGGIGVLRQEILEMLPSLRRRGVVESWREHSPGSLIVKLAPVSSLMSAGKRKRDVKSATVQSTPRVIAGLSPDTRQVLRQLAIQNLGMLGIVATDQFVDAEMGRTFSTLMTAVLDSADREAALHMAIVNAIEEQANP